jgi:putative NADPH-quinone reductase
VLFFPLWLGGMPALLKAFLEQVARPGFAFTRNADHPFGEKGLTRRSARIVVAMSMPAALYRWFYRAHSPRSLERNILGFVGIGPVEESLIGMIGSMDEKAAQNTCARWRNWGARQVETCRIRLKQLFAEFFQ